MTGNEKTDNRIRAWALVLMAAVVLVSWGDDYSVLYGLCAQVATEAAAKYFYICRWMKRAPVGLWTYIRWWLPPAGAIAAAYLLGRNDSFFAMLVLAGLVFVYRGIRELKDPENAFLRKGKAHDEA